MHGQDKGLQELNQIALIDYVIASLEPQVDTIIINANRNITEYEQRGYPVIADDFGEFEGPLAGIMAAMQTLPDDMLLLVVPCDMPILPANLVEQLVAQLQHDQAELCCVKLQQRLQPLISIIRTSTLTSLREYLLSGRHKVQDWVESLHYTCIDLDEPGMFNINTPEDLSAFEKHIRQ